MPATIAEYFRGMVGKPYVVQFVMSIAVTGHSASYTQVTAYLLPSASEQEARESALGMMNSLSESYRNTCGEVVTVSCVGIHCVEELNYVDDDGYLQLATILFSKATLPSDLVREQASRNDLPNLD